MDSHPYIIYKNGTNTEAENTKTKQVEFNKSSSAEVFNLVLNKVTGDYLTGKPKIRDGIYNIDQAILMKHFTGFKGESREKTILRCTATTDENELFRYWKGSNSKEPLDGFSLEDLKLEIHNKNGNNSGMTKVAWITSGTKDLTLRNVWVKSCSKPTVSWIGFFIDTANRTNYNENARILNCRFEGPCFGQDMLGCGNLVNCDFSENEFINCDAQAIGIGSTYKSIIARNRFVNTGNAIGYEDLCTDNFIGYNLCYETDGIKLSQEKSADTNISRNNTCIGNKLYYGWGGIEAGISIDDVICNNYFYRTGRNGIYGSFCRSIVDNNTFIDTNYEWAEQPLLGTTGNHKIGGIVAYNSKAPTTIMPNNNWNSFDNNTFIRSGTNFVVDGSTRSGKGGGIVIDTKYQNSMVYRVKGNLGAELLKNYGTKAP